MGVAVYSDKWGMGEKIDASPCGYRTNKLVNCPFFLFTALFSLFILPL